MDDFILKEIVSQDISSELELIGFDSGYKNLAVNKFKYKNIKIFNLSVAQANIVKQTALSVGADCGTNKNVVTGVAGLSNVLLGGSYAQLNKISDKLKNQPFKLSKLSDKIKELLDKENKKTKLIGILNITPDSFSDGGLYIEPLDACKHLVNLINDGADGIDIGAESTKPYSKPTDSKEQIKRLKPILEFIQKENIDISVSVDTRSSVVADFALNNGVKIINDVSGFDFDNNMPKVISKYNAGVVIQHSKGTPENMQNNPEYVDLIDEIYLSLNKKIEYAFLLGIKNVIADPGIGFGKTKGDNLEILNRIEEFYSLKVPIMVGVSRKSFLGVTDNNNDLKDRMTLAVSYPLIMKNVDYLRVHNISAHKILINNLSV